MPSNSWAPADGPKTVVYDLVFVPRNYREVRPVIAPFGSLRFVYVAGDQSLVWSHNSGEEIGQAERSIYFSASGRRPDADGGRSCGKGVYGVHNGGIRPDGFAELRLVPEMNARFIFFFTSIQTESCENMWRIRSACFRSVEADMSSRSKYTRSKSEVAWSAGRPERLFHMVCARQPATIQQSGSFRLSQARHTVVTEEFMSTHRVKSAPSDAAIAAI